MAYRFPLFEEWGLRHPGLQETLFVLLLVLLAFLILYNGILKPRLDEAKADFASKATPERMELELPEEIQPP